MIKKIVLELLMLCYIFNSCSGQQKEEKQNKKIEIYSARCEGTYSTGKNVTENEKKWRLSKDDILSIINLSHEIDENEIHFAYPITPCKIDIAHFDLNGINVSLNINGGSFLYLTENEKTKILACDNPKCKKYFLLSKEEMDDDESQLNTPVDTYKIDKTNDSIVIRQINDSSEFSLNIYQNEIQILDKNFSCDNLKLDLDVKYNQLFNLKLEYKDQYGNIFRKITIPIFSKENQFYVEKIFVATLSADAKTGNNEWFYKEKSLHLKLKNLELDALLE